MFLLIFFCPEDPAIDTHHRIVKINAGLTKQMTFHAEPDVNDSIDQSNRVHQNIFQAAEPHTCNAGKYGNEFKPACLFHAIDKLLIYFLERQEWILSKIHFGKLSATIDLCWDSSSADEDILFPLMCENVWEPVASLLYDRMSTQENANAEE